MAVFRTLFGKDARILGERDFQALLLANVVAPLGNGILSPILDTLIQPFQTSPANIGLLISFFTAPAIVMIPIAGVLTDQLGRKPILIAGLLLMGGAGTAIPFAPDFQTALGLRLLQGIAFGGITPVIITSLGDIYEETEEATAQGIRFTGSGLSSSVFPLLSGVVVVFAWQYPFYIFAMAFPIAGVVYLWFSEPTDTDARQGATGSRTVRSQLGELFRIVLRQRVLALVIARGLPMFVWIGFLTYNSIVVVNILGGSPTDAGVLVAVASLMHAGGASQAGRLTGLLKSRLYPLIGGNVCLGVGFAVFVFAPTLLIAGVGVTIVGLGFGVTLSLYRSIITGLATESLRGGVVSLAEAFGRVTSTATPVCMGAGIALLSTRLGVNSAIQVAGLGVAVLSAAGGVCCVVIASRSPREPYESVA